MKDLQNTLIINNISELLENARKKVVVAVNQTIVLTCFKEDFIKIWTKIRKLEGLVLILKWILSLLFLIFLLFALVQIFNPVTSDKKDKISVETETINIIVKEKKHPKEN